MTNYSFKEIVNYFGEKLKSEAAEEDIEEGLIELMLDDNHVLLRPGKQFGSFNISLELGMLTGPIPESHLKELTSSNFMGVNTGGCSLFFDEAGSIISLATTTTPGTSPQENWEWLHRIYSIAQQWTNYMSKWEEFTPLATFPMEKNDGKFHPPGHRIFKA